MDIAEFLLPGMEKKTKIWLSAILIIVIAAGIIYFFFPTIKDGLFSLLEESKIINSGQKTPEPSVDLEPAPTRFISGQIRSINETQLHLELSDGQGFIAKITAKTPVRAEAGGSIKSLADLKPKTAVAVEVNQDDIAQEIVIKK